MLRSSLDDPQGAPEAEGGVLGRGCGQDPKY